MSAPIAVVVLRCRGRELAALWAALAAANVRPN